MTWPISVWWRRNILYVSGFHLSCPSQPNRCAGGHNPLQLHVTCSLWLSNPTDWFLVDQENAGGEDGPRGCGARPRRGQHHRGGREHLDCQPLWPLGKDLEPWTPSKTGNECRALSAVQTIFLFSLTSFPILFHLAGFGEWYMVCMEWD